MPDWTDQASYKKKRTRFEWTWEFMRRNTQYRKDYARFEKLRKSVQQGVLYKGGARVVRMDKMGRTLGSAWDQRNSIADPARDRPPTFVAPGPVEPDDEQLGSYYDEEGIQKKNFATLTFDLRPPLEPQLERARKRLKERRKGVTLIKPVRAAEGWWPLYLQLLDAVEAGVSQPEMKTSIKRYRTLYKGDKRAGSNRVSANLKRAKDLRDSPLSILL